LRQAEFLVGSAVDGFDLTAPGRVSFVLTRTPLPFVVVASEGFVPMAVTAYDGAGATLDHWVLDAIDEVP
jgi:hypothetical protein